VSRCTRIPNLIPHLDELVVIEYSTEPQVSAKTRASFGAAGRTKSNLTTLVRHRRPFPKSKFAGTNECCMKNIGTAKVTETRLLETWFLFSCALRIFFGQYSVEEFNCVCKILKLFLLLSFVFEELSRTGRIRYTLMDRAKVVIQHLPNGRSVWITQAERF
jgi:hypothetical protein